MINIEGFKNEQSLRTTIKRNLEKEYHHDTRSSVDFINKLLNDACSECKYGMATLSLKDFYEIMKYAKIGFIQ